MNSLIDENKYPGPNGPALPAWKGANIDIVTKVIGKCLASGRTNKIGTRPSVQPPGNVMLKTERDLFNAATLERGIN